ncbi:hypothetical protein [Paraburkholderia silvatlantica]|uniref:Serine/threonine protein kinase n=1 Tax=Paraburkholderia silvatlantica TaxID=321895 RepID=A0ABR6FL18_9BURK|nr:hypothetical protein [Paraburkholderia silvatlantica]MBB2927510.1 hypothetical protein [Paraburkholderia silvatlantica]PVY36223.1 hypothetical protein C7411_10394 [Paraburkholderia silvatlantica]PXW40361.1 hypothetical protein C7413_104224 [Paraburkholderia silvatlantica]
MKLFYLLLSSSLFLAACGGGGSGSSGTDASNASATAQNASDATAADATANAATSTRGTLHCGSAVKSGASSSSELVSADTPTTQSGRIFASGTAFPLAFTTNAPAADMLNWSITDHVGKVVTSGSLRVTAGPATTTLSCTSTLAGYFSVSAKLATAGGQLPELGTRPAGTATFGVLPNLAGIVPAVTYPHQDLHRFGMQGEDDNTSVLSSLGISWTYDHRELYNMEPSGPNTFNPNANNLDPFYTTGNVMRLVRLDGIPAWASPTGAFEDESLPPADSGYYQNYMARIGTESNLIRTTYFPKQAANYYQLTWEPDAQWQGTNTQFVQLYQAVYQGIHSTDPHAVVMGPTDTAPSGTADHLKALAPLGYAQDIDGVTTHGYYDINGSSPSFPPERLETDPANASGSLMGQMRALRSEMAADYKPGMKLFSTELGISYDNGTTYSASYPTGNVLYAQGALVARSHVIILGEGADQTWIFYGADFPGLVGYGTFFDLADAQGQYGAQNISPKPAAMAVAAMTRILDGTNTLGPVKSTPSGVYGYAFRQLSNGAVITALWTHNNNVWSASAGYSSTYSVGYSLAVDAPGTSGTVTVLDEMGNPTTKSYSNGKVALSLTESPVYVISQNATVASANATLPAGYVAN